MYYKFLMKLKLHCIFTFRKKKCMRLVYEVFKIYFFY